MHIDESIFSDHWGCTFPYCCVTLELVYISWEGLLHMKDAEGLALCKKTFLWNLQKMVLAMCFWLGGIWPECFHSSDMNPYVIEKWYDWKYVKEQKR